jgi:hypothetical protein
MWEIAKAISSAVTFVSPGDGHNLLSNGVMEMCWGALGSAPETMMFLSQLSQLGHE